MTLVVVNGIRLNAKTRAQSPRHGGGGGEALLLLHGFTGAASTWHDVSASWDGWRRIAVDLIGHGGSDAPDDERRYTMEDCVADLVALLDELAIDRATVLGYSMGGRVALQLAAAAPERVAALVLEGASPGIDDAGERAARVLSDRALADDIERDGIEAFVDRWERVPIFATQARLPDDVRARQRRQRLSNRPAGLANSLRGMGAGAQSSLWPRLQELAMPALLIAGEDDAKYSEMAHDTASRMPAADVRIVPGAGHAVHLERPGAFSDHVKEFLTRCQSDHQKLASSPRP
ncbi:MAG: 2-succinyl-6-hydroxy-2,4-cyclohexadiene-1-carboxylate synthase [Dehalococcoidia bacterium]|nr:MAG: 2-succinyl-6-hydroxy-2,4-cyclohexadiene-1-carboxylate synthase [Dehalococcoidia bacterium]